MRDKIGLIFKHQLNEALQKKYGRRISSAFLALQFNLIVEDDLSISRETARKWLKGQSLPEIKRIKVLLDWLHIDANGFLRMATGTNIPHSPPSSYYKDLYNLVAELDEGGRKLVLLTAWSLQTSFNKKNQTFDDFYMSVSKK